MNRKTKWQEVSAAPMPQTLEPQPQASEIREAGFNTPARQAIFSALLVFMPFCVVAAGIALTVKSWPWVLGITAAGMVAGCAYGLWMFRTAYNDRLWLEEKRLDRDLDGDGMIGQPAQPQPLRVEVTDDKGRHQVYADIPAQLADKLPAMARAVLQGRKYTYVSIVTEGNYLTRGDWDAWNKLALSRGWMKYNHLANSRAGIAFTHAGGEVLKALASRYTPSPTDSGRA